MILMVVRGEVAVEDHHGDPVHAEPDTHTALVAPVTVEP